jgi:sulfatase maturation enzyme AslB (radical SAM superfamily)
MKLIQAHRPLHVSIVGGEPLVRFRELNELLPKLSKMGLSTQVVTSAVRPIPQEWSSIKNLQICVSIDGLQEEHDRRRAPATYDRILKHINGHRITVHCTITRQQISQNGYLEKFVHFWSAQSAVHQIWFSIYTPQIGEESPEKLTIEDRKKAIEELLSLRQKYSKLKMNAGTIRNYGDPPKSPDHCIFARVTKCVSADLRTNIAPCQFGGKPDCKNCGCMASAGLEVVGRYRLLPGLPISRIFALSFATGSLIRKIRNQAAFESLESHNSRENAPA